MVTETVTVTEMVTETMTETVTVETTAVTAATAVTPPVLHVPDEPTGRAEVWLAAVLDGRALDEVLSGNDGVAAWLWHRWRSLASVGMVEDDLERLVLEYRREVWLWLAGERTWAQSCSGLIGRIGRRLSNGGHAGR